MKRVNYLSNKELLMEIHKSKLSFCSFINPQYQDRRFGYYDMIVESLDGIDAECVHDARAAKATRVAKQTREELLTRFKPHEIRIKPDPANIPIENLVFRVMTNEHVPKDRLKSKKDNDGLPKVNFPPFKHYVIINNKVDEEGKWLGGDFVEVLRSHWIGGANEGEFNVEHGKITEGLATRLMMLVEKYSQRGNWRGYTYVDEMKGQALLQLSQICLQFDESRTTTPNPFAYYTAVCTNSFRRILNIEKKSQSLRDDLLQMHGVSPSFTRQVEHERAERERNGNGTPP